MYTWKNRLINDEYRCKVMMVKKVVDGKEIMESEDVIREVVCFSCRWLLFYPRCMAYPKIIPQDIRDGLHDHTLERGDEEFEPGTNKRFIFNPLFRADD